MQYRYDNILLEQLLLNWKAKLEFKLKARGFGIQMMGVEEEERAAGGGNVMVE